MNYDLVTGRALPKKRKTNVTEITQTKCSTRKECDPPEFRNNGDINQLPFELLHHVFQYLSKTDLLHLGQVCKSWKEDFQDSEPLWRMLCKREFPLLSNLMEEYHKSSSWRAHYQWCFKFRVLVITTDKEVPSEPKFKDIKRTLVQSGFIHNPDTQVQRLRINLQTDGLTVESAMDPIYPKIQVDAKIYNCALFYGHCLEFSSDQIVGDLLADYIDQGGGVVVCPFVNIIPFHLGGRWQRQKYSPLLCGSVCFTSRLSLGKVLKPDHPMMRGVHSLTSVDSCIGEGSVSPDAELIAEWSNGTPLLACSQTRPRVVALNLYPPSSNVKKMYWDQRTDGAALIGNALLYTVK